VAERDGVVGGYVIAIRAADEAEILNLCVALTARRAGTGSALVRAIIGRLAALGARHAYLEVRSSIAAARRLYEREGFEPVGRRRGYYRRPVEDDCPAVCHPDRGGDA
jgi:ribosomal-protein-alanine N-acetyltransferase